MAVNRKRRRRFDQYGGACMYVCMVWVYLLSVMAGTERTTEKTARTGNTGTACKLTEY